DVDTGLRTDLLTYEGRITFLPSPTTGSIAYQVTPDDQSQGGGGRVSFPRSPRGRAQAGTPEPALDGVLAVRDASGRTVEVLDEPATAFQWSPDGTRLAFLDPQDNGTSMWRFWSPSGTVDGPSYAPSPESDELMLQFFDQLAPTTRWWAPDGSAFAFAGRIQGREGIWVVATTGGVAPSHVHEGGLVAWSPR
ncbi:MAG TPA: hypothetical protein VF183_10680, partial [Acidimicrobiales bacterium]